ncbi:MAG: type II toxin-antitoxin system HicB family antitoxin [Clostridia bacterium]|nr:type II toxin-antitoxin system HicB family antitoxin [Clostridia bacterium]
MKYVFPAVFSEEETGYSVRFPDVSGCYTDGENLAEAVAMAEDALNLMLYTLEEKGLPINRPSDIRSLILGENEFATLIPADTLEYRRYFDSKAVKKTLTIPSWLNTMSERENINFSAVLQEALIEKLHLNNS